ncbi:MAG: sodium/solute symporter [Hyphomonadaceae bacterium]|nr:sodium/solute symporter [Hyphomonadaceae bacterium]
MQNFGALNWSIVIAYLIANLLLGYFMSRRVKTSQDYYLGDRSAPWWAIGISVVATYVSALSFLGGPAWAYGDGMAALAIHVNYPLVIFAVIVFFLPFFFNSGVASIYEYLERRFGKTSRTVMSSLFLLTQSITAASILTATAVVVTFVTGIDPKIAIVLMTAIVLVYTLMGGMNAVIWTDVLQGIILFLGAGIILYNLLGAVSPLSSAFDTLSETGKLNPINADFDFSVAPTIWAGVFAMTLFHITVYGANQMMVQRALAAKNIGDAKKSYLLMGFAAFFIYFLFFFIGALLFVHFKGDPFEQPNEIILVFARSLALPGLMGILAAAVLSASMSSLSSAFNSLATISVTDMYQEFFNKDASEKHYLNASRLFTIIWGLLVIPMAFAFVSSKGSILETLTAVASYFVGAKLAMFGMGFFSKHVTQRGLLIGVAAGFIGIYIFKLGIPFTDWTPPTIAWPWFVVIGGAINIVVSWVASVLLDGFKKEWHPQSVPGQIKEYRDSGKAEKDGGWYVVPGKVDKIAWALPVFFVFTIAFLAWFGTMR